MKSRFIILITLAWGLYSCNEQLELPTQNNDIPLTVPVQLTPEEYLSLASYMPQPDDLAILAVQDFQTTVGVDPADCDYSIVHAKAVENDDRSLKGELRYVRIKTAGSINTAIVFQAENYAKVITYCQGETNTDTHNSLELVSLASQVAPLQYIETLQKTLATQTLRKIAHSQSCSIDNINWETVTTPFLTRGEPISDVTAEIEAGTYPMAGVLWDENYPYTILMPKNIYYNQDGAHYPPYWTLNHYCLSVAHAVACLEPKTFDGLTFDWLNLKRHSSIPANWQSSLVGQTYANEVGNLLRKIFDGLDCSVLRNPAHTQDVFETTSTFEKEHAYLTRVAKCSAIQQWDLNKIVQSVGRMYPVIIAAKQYFYSDFPTSPSTREVTFVVDGYFSCKSKYNGRPNDTYLHVLFPINYKLCNGYYLCDRDQELDMDIMLTDQTNYEMRSSDMKLITDIHL